MGSINDQVKKREAIRRRGEKILKILEILAQGSAGTIALMAAFAPGTTYSMAKSLGKMPREINKFFADQKQENQFRSLLSYLQKGGLVTKKSINNEIKWRLTSKGKEKIVVLNKQVTNIAGLPMPTYISESSDKLAVVIFDIPEREKAKREWLRWVLKHLGFSLVQESVWMGKLKIPKELLKDLKKHNLLSCVKIFSVTEIGNLD